MLRRGIVFAAVFQAGLSVAGQVQAQLKAGYARAENTPNEPIWMGGYNLRKSPSEAVHPGEKLYLSVLVFESGATRVAFLEADVIGIRDHDSWRKRISQETAIPADHILLGDVHNHSSPAPNSKTNANWTRQLGDSIVPTVKRIVADLRPVRIAAGQGSSRIGVNRRAIRPADGESYLTFDENNRSQSFGEFKTDHPVKIREFAGEVRLGANPGGPIDEAVQLVRIDTDQGRPYALMVHYACHGTSLGGRNSKITGEWMGRMQAYLESQIEGLNAIYLQGAAGDVNPRVVGGLDGNRDDVGVTHALGEEIGREALRVYRSLVPGPVTQPRVEVVSREILLPRTYRELLAGEVFRNPAVRAPTTALRIGDLMWVTFPGELFNTIGKRVKAATNRP